MWLQKRSVFLAHCLVPSKQFGGVPQAIYTLELQDHVESGLVGFTVPDFLDRPIIGPTEFPVTLHDAFLEVMDKAKIQNRADKLVVSHIPLRPSSP